MKHKRSIMSTAMAGLVLVSLCAVCSSVSAAQGANVQTPPLVGASVVGAPAVCSQDGKSLDLFVRGANGSVYWKHSKDGTTWPSTSTCLGGLASSDPTVTASIHESDMRVFVRGTDGALWVKPTYDGGATWDTWYKIPASQPLPDGQLLKGTGPAACLLVGSGFYYFVTGTDNALYYMLDNNTGYYGWYKLGGVLTSSPAASAMTLVTGDQISVVVRGSDNALWARSTDNGGGSWTTWSSRGGQLLKGTGPATCNWGSARTTGWFATGTDNALWWQGPSSTSWKSLGGVLTSSPAATSRSSGTIDVFVRGSDNGLWQKFYNQNGWSSWGSEPRQYPIFKAALPSSSL